MSEEDFRSRLAAELSEEEAPPLGGLVADALGDGVRRRRRRHLAQVLGSAAGVTAVAVAATAVAHGGIAARGAAAASGATPAGGVTLAASATPSAAESPGVSGTPSAPDTPSGSKGLPAKPAGGGGPGNSNLPHHWTPAPAWMTGDQHAAPADGVPATGKSVAAVLIDDVQKLGGKATHVTGSPQGIPGPSGQYSADLFWQLSTVAVRVYDSGHGLEVGCWDTAPGAICEDYKLADGTWVNYSYMPGRSGTVDIKDEKTTAMLIINRPDGTQTAILELNGREQGNYGADRSGLPLSEQQLWTIATDSRLGPVMDRSFVQYADKTVVLSPDDY